MLTLDNVTLIIVDCIEYDRAKFALEHCKSKIKFKDAKLLTHFDVEDDSVVKIPQITSIKDYSLFLLKELTLYFDTEFVLHAQHDGFVWNPHLWEDEFLNYDYIGAPWPDEVIGEGVPKHFNVGNGGFSLRSKKLQDHLRTDKNIITHESEDCAIGQLNRAYLEMCGFKYAPYEVAKRFSFELIPWIKQPITQAFGAHGFKLLN